MAVISYFSSSPVSDGTSVTSILDIPNLITAIQDVGADTYFDTTSEIGQVIVYLRHVDGRQEKRIVHDAASHTGPVQWSSFARDGVWQKTKILAFDRDGATVALDRVNIGSGEDCTHSGGQMLLNVS